MTEHRLNAERKPSRNRKPRVIVATCKSEQDVAKVLKIKRDLRECRQHNKHVYVEPDVPLQQRIQNSSLRNIVSVFGVDKLEIRGSRVVPRPADRSVDQQLEHRHRDRHDSDSRQDHDQNNWEVKQSSRKRHRMDRSGSRKNSHSRERGIHKFMIGVHQGTCHMTVHNIMECVAGAITQVKSQGQIKTALV